MSAGKGLLLWAPVVLYTALIFCVSSIYRPIPGIEFFLQIDKLYHVAEYGPFGILLARALTRSFLTMEKGRVYWLCFLGALLVGGTDEFYQSFVPLKDASIFDVTADIVGAVVGAIFYRRRRQRR